MLTPFTIDGHTTLMIGVDLKKLVNLAIPTGCERRSGHNALTRRIQVSKTVFYPGSLRNDAAMMHQLSRIDACR